MSEPYLDRDFKQAYKLDISKHMNTRNIFLDQMEDTE